MSVFIGADNFTSRGLPSGYTQLEYIKSSGTQCIDTGVSISSSNAANIKWEVETQITLGSNYHINGTGNGQSPYINSMYLGFDISGAPVYGDGQTDQVFSASKTYGGEKVTITYDAPNQKLNITGYVSNQSFTFKSPSGAINFLLFGYGRGTETKLHTAKIYSAKMWQSGTLIRDFVPCKNSSGTLGLYDLVNSKFYTNAGSGTFTAGTAYVSGNKAREVDEIDLGVSAIAREVSDGWLGVSGIAREVFGGKPSTSDLVVGDSVFMNVNGVSKEFIVVHQGLPSSDYDSSCDGTWLMMKEIYEDRVWDASNENDYDSSDIHPYLNGTFLNLFDSDIKGIIKTVKIPYTNSSGSVVSGANGLSTQVFLYSVVEVGLSTNGLNTEGAVLSYFNGVDNSMRLAYLNGTVADWWLRTPYTWGGVANQACRVGTVGQLNNMMSYLVAGVRPALILPSDTNIDESYNVIA